MPDYPVDPPLVGSGSYRQDAVRVAALEMLRRADRPTAVFAANDISALEIVKVAAELGLDVPQDLSIIGFDDVPEASAANPALSTVRQPMQTLGAEAARHAARAHAGRDAGGHAPQTADSTRAARDDGAARVSVGTPTLSAA